jgi:hypothetical protein
MKQVQATSTQNHFMAFFLATWIQVSEKRNGFLVLSSGKKDRSYEIRFKNGIQ